jgi:hypothetical protein
MLAYSNAGYDSGLRWEAKRLATAVYTLVHDAGKIRSLLGQLGYKEKLGFVSSGKMGDFSGFENFHAAPALVVVEFDPPRPPIAKPKCRMVQNLSLPSMAFDQWWKNEVIFVRKGDILLNRMKLVESLRHQDGGAHVGALTKPGYVDLKAGGGITLSEHGGLIIEAGYGAGFEGLADASMRQVAWEIEETLKQIEQFEQPNPSS